MLRVTFPDLRLKTADYEKAAEFFNICRSKGVQGSNTDFLICAISVNRDYPIFTTDRDFEKFQKLEHHERNSDFNETGINIKIELEKIIENIFVNPYAPKWYFNVVKEIVAKFSLNINVNLSNLSKEPLY